jgi:hypothetical protein
MDSTRRFLAILSSAGISAIACADPAGPAAGVHIRPTAREYALTPRGTAEISYAVLNSGGTAVLLTSRCGDRLSPAVQRKDTDEWQQYSGGMCITSLDMSPVPLDAGARRDEVVLVGMAGEYRLVIGTDRGPAVSPAFIVR